MHYTAKLKFRSVRHVLKRITIELKLSNPLKNKYICKVFKLLIQALDVNIKSAYTKYRKSLFCFTDDLRHTTLSCEQNTMPTFNLFQCQMTPLVYISHKPKNKHTFGYYNSILHVSQYEQIFILRNRSLSNPFRTGAGMFSSICQLRSGNISVVPSNAH